MDESEYEPDTWVSESSGHAFVRNLLGRSGWEEYFANRGRAIDDCGGELEVFVDAVLDLRTKLERRKLFADTDSDIVGLARMTTQPWARFVDPALSTEGRIAGSGSLLVLWECPEHILALHNRSGRRWRLVNGVDEILDLREFLGIDDEEAIDANEEEHVAQTLTTEYLSPADMERRKLLSSEQLERLNQDQGEL